MIAYEYLLGQWYKTKDGHAQDAHAQSYNGRLETTVFEWIAEQPRVWIYLGHFSTIRKPNPPRTQLSVANGPGVVRSEREPLDVCGDLIFEGPGDQGVEIFRNYMRMMG